MKNTKLVRLLKALDKKELKGFEKHLLRLYGKHETAIKLFRHLKKYHPDFKHKNLDKGFIATEILETDNLKRVSNEASQLYEWLEDFLMLKQLKKVKNDGLKSRLLDTLYEEKGLFEDRYNLLEKRKKVLGQQKNKGQVEYYELLTVNRSQYYHLYKDNFKKDVRKSYWEATKTQFSIFTCLFKLQYNCEAICRNNIFKENYEILAVEIDKEITNLPNVKLYRLVYDALQEMKMANYKVARDFLFQNQEFISTYDGNVCYNYLVNLLSKLIRKDADAYVAALFELYQLGVESLFIIAGEGEKISTIRFNNVVNVAYSLKEYAWADDFIKDYAIYLPLENRRESEQLAQAIILFGRGKYEIVRKQLESLEYDNQGNEIRGRITLIACLYEMKDVENIEKALHSLRKFVHRKKNLTDTIKASVRNYLNVVQKLVERDVEKVTLEDKLQQFTYLYMKIWLKEKIAQYKKLR